VTVRPKVAEVPIGSLLIVMAVTVIVEMLTGVDDAVVKVRTELPWIKGVGGRNVAVTPVIRWMRDMLVPPSVRGGHAGARPPFVAGRWHCGLERD
jgi:hypothetical protein